MIEEHIMVVAVYALEGFGVLAAILGLVDHIWMRRETKRMKAAQDAWTHAPEGPRTENTPGIATRPTPAWHEHLNSKEALNVTACEHLSSNVYAEALNVTAGLAHPVSMWPPPEWPGCLSSRWIE